jgi:ribosome-binding protein aMBF1 (putative translation factor)
MRFDGYVYRDGHHWLAGIPILDAMTQGRTKKEALEMIADWVETLVNQKGFSATIHSVAKDRFEIEGSDAAAMTALLLRRKRETSGLSLAAVAANLGARSRNAYARYERGEAVPSIETLERLLDAVSPGGTFVIRDGGR